MGVEANADSGDVLALKREGTLRASAIGSCVVVAAYDPDSGVGGMAHVMLPGAPCGPRHPRKTIYAEPAVEEMIGRMSALGAEQERIRACLVGGGNLLGPGHEAPGVQTVESLRGTLDGRGIPIMAEDVGGTQRRSCMMDVASGRVAYTVGGSEQKELWRSGSGRKTPGDGSKGTA